MAKSIRIIAPLFTWMMAGLMELVGPVYPPLQMMAVAFGALAIASLSMIAGRAGGWLAGGICFVLLLSLAPCQKFFTTMVVTTPALGLAAAGIAVIVLVPSSSGAALLGGFLIGLATVTKLSFIYFGPVGLSYAVQRVRVVGGGGGGRSGALLLAGWTIPVAAISPLCETRAMIPQLITPHVAALAAFADHTNRALLLLSADLPVLYGCGVLALAILAATSLGTVWPLLVWTAIVAAWASLHRPIWAHHLPEVVAPLVGAIGIVLAEVIRKALSGERTVYLLSCAGLWLCSRRVGWPAFAARPMVASVLQQHAHRSAGGRRSQSARRGLQHGSPSAVSAIPTVCQLASGPPRTARPSGRRPAVRPGRARPCAENTWREGPELGVPSHHDAAGPVPAPAARRPAVPLGVGGA